MEKNENQKAVEVFNDLAEEYQEKYMDVSLYHDTFDFFCDHIKQPNPRVLEIACGPGNITRYLLQKRPDFNLLGIDLAPNMIKLAENNNPSANFRVMDCKDIPQVGKTFDAVLIGFCLPYLTQKDVLQLLKNCSKLLTTNGLLYLSTMEGDYSQSSYEKGSSSISILMHYYSAELLTQMLQALGFEILKLDRKTYIDNKGKDVVDLIIIANAVHGI